MFLLEHLLYEHTKLNLKGDFPFWHMSYRCCIHIQTFPWHPESLLPFAQNIPILHIIRFKERKAPVRQQSCKSFHHRRCWRGPGCRQHHTAWRYPCSLFRISLRKISQARTSIEDMTYRQHRKSIRPACKQRRGRGRGWRGGGWWRDAFCWCRGN